MADVAPTGSAMSATHIDSDDNVRTDASRGPQQNRHKTANINGSDDPINNNNERRPRKLRSKLSHNGSQNAKKQAEGGGKRVRNSYLKIAMDDESVDLMFDMAQRMRQVIKERFLDVPEGQKKEETSRDGKEISDEEGANPYPDRRPSKKRTPPRPLTFKPRSRNSLHMTFFFGGTAIREIPPEELVEWHGQVMDRLRQASKSMGDTESESGTTESSRYTLHFRELSLFPPQRHTLIVAIFDGSPNLHKLHDDLRDIAKDSNSEGLKDAVKCSKERWTAHVTLGDLYGGGRGEAKQEQLNELAKMLQDGIGLEVLEGKEDLMHPSDFTAKVKGIAMGGPVCHLRWN